MLRFSYFIVALTIFGFCQAASVQDEKPIIRPRVVGGLNAPIQDFKYQVGLDIGGVSCAGTIIKPKWVLTAGHCVIGAIASDILVRVGSNKLNEGGVTSRVVKVITHPQFKINHLYIEYDATLLKLKVSLKQFMDDRPVKGIALASVLPGPDETVVLSGFGLTTHGGSPADLLQKAEVKMIDINICNPSYDNQLSPSMFCAGIWEGGKGSCHGDSGGPLVYKGTLIGIVSFGRICAAATFPGVYTSVPFIRQWIITTIKRNTP